MLALFLAGFDRGKYYKSINKEPKVVKKAKSKSKSSRSIKVLLQKTNLALASFVAISLLIGVGVGYFLNQPHDARYNLASRSEIKLIKQEITKQYQADSSTNCTDDTDPIKPADRVEVFKEYLKVNKYGNRAVIRGCNDGDSLLAKNPISGAWEMTNVNVSLDLRANPSWQVECMIDDITIADDVTRSENNGIDINNFVACRQLKEREQITAIFVSSGTDKDFPTTEAIIKDYIKSAEDFFSL